MVKKECLACSRSDDEVPLIRLSYRDNDLWICPQHMPTLIHDPAQLTGKIPGAEGFPRADTTD
jgi:hypothetical protein